MAQPIRNVLFDTSGNTPSRGGNYAPSAGPQMGGAAPFGAGSGPWFSGAAAPTSVPFGGPVGSMGSIGSGGAVPYGNPAGSAGYDDEDYDNEPPLLEELGINFQHIIIKTKNVINPTRAIDAHIVDEADLAGPLVYALLLGVCLLFAAKVHFGYIYGFGGVGCFVLYLLINLISPSHSIDVYRVISIFGYCLLPVVVLAAVNIVYRISNMGVLGFILASVCILWSTLTATRFLEKVLNMKEQRYLLAYPIGLFYSVFALISVF